MKLFAWLVLVWALAASCAPASAGLSLSPGTPAHTHSDANTGGGTLSVSGTLSSTKACASGYTRLGPNFCSRPEAGQSDVSIVRDTCTAIAMPDSGAKALLLRVNVGVKSSNGAALRFSIANFYDGVGCTALVTRLIHQHYEEVAKIAGTMLGTVDVTLIVPIPNGLPKSSLDDDVGDQGSSILIILGYFD